MSSLDRDRSFDMGQLGSLQSTGDRMMNAFLSGVEEAEGIISDLLGLCSELGSLEVEDVLSGTLSA